jgi:regulator of ribonuclease activity A
MSTSSTPVPATTDLCDAHKDGQSLRVLPPVFRSFGGVARFCGRVSTVKCFEDNTLVKAAVDSPGEGRVLVVDGCVRDVTELAGCAVGIRALASVPLPTVKRSEGQADVPVQVQGVWIQPGDWLCADEDGIVVADRPLGAAAS